MRSPPPKQSAVEVSPGLESNSSRCTNGVGLFFWDGKVEKTTLDKVKQDAQTTKHTHESDEDSERPTHSANLTVSRGASAGGVLPVNDAALEAAKPTLEACPEREPGM